MRGLLACTLAVLSPLAALGQTASDYHEQGLALKADNKIEEARAKFEQAIALEDTRVESRFELAWCLNYMGDHGGAQKHLEVVKKAWPDVPRVFFEAGYAAKELGQFDAARQDFGRCLELKPDYYGAHRELGYISYDLDQHEAAIGSLAKLIEMFPDRIDYLVWYRKGYSENAIRRYTDAKQSLFKSRELKEDHLNTHLELGFACTKLKQDYEAIAHFQKAAELDPKSHIPTNGIAEVYRDNQRDMPKAMEWYGKTLALNPKERKACFGMGYCLNSQQKFAEAIPYLEQAIASESSYTAAYVELGYSHHRTDRHADALAQFAHALRLNPKSENARFYSGLVYISQRDRASAQRMVDELRALNSRHADSLQQKVSGL